jgi:crotonobetainyl-CoA:carnitine CoA-transferase CaiB-like acyl-CoA transferase
VPEAAPGKADAPLAGLKVVELARVLAGPFAGQILADLGAEVIKVESPEGDGTRQWGPPWLTRDNGDREAAYYHACNRGKRSVVADFNIADELGRVVALCAQADVVIENFKPGTLDKFGLDYASVAAANPAVVYCSITGFGQDGPRRDEPGYDFVIQAMSGLMSITGDPEGAPMKSGVSMSDLTCGLWSANAIQAALLMRHRTGKGQWIDMALLDCSVALLANQAMSYFATRLNPPRMGNAHAQVVPYGVYPTANGHVVLAPANDRLFRALAHLLQRPDLAADARLQDNAGRIEHRAWLEGEIAAESRSWRQQDLLDACARAGVPAGPIQDLEAVFSDPQVVARGMVIAPGGVPGIRSPFRFSNAGLSLDEPSPTRGQHGKATR